MARTTKSTPATKSTEKTNNETETVLSKPETVLSKPKPVSSNPEVAEEVTVTSETPIVTHEYEEIKGLGVLVTSIVRLGNNLSTSMLFLKDAKVIDDTLVSANN